MVASHTVGQAEDDPEVRTAGRPSPSDDTPTRSRRMQVMADDDTVDRLDAWAQSVGVSRSTAALLAIRRVLEQEGF